MNKNNNKKIYSEPQIELIKLDNEISLSLLSDPPYGPGETIGAAPQYLSNDPYKTEDV